MTDKRLIDANALHKRIEMNLRACNPFSIVEGCYKDALNSVDEAPTIDPESLSGHARWVKDENVKIITVDAYGNTFESPAVYCENCNTALSEADFKSRVWNYCPVCGFIMEDATNGQ